MAPRDTLPQLDLDTQDGIEPDVAGPVVKHNPLIGFAAGICSGTDQAGRRASIRYDQGGSFFNFMSAELTVCSDAL